MGAPHNGLPSFKATCAPSSTGRSLGKMVHGPKAHFYVGRDARLYVISVGRANHAGNRAAVVLDEVRRGIAPSGTALSRGVRTLA